MATPKMEPAPKSSRTAPIQTRAKVNPRPMPAPSNAEMIGLFFIANASARPKITQFTTIRGM